MPGPRKNSADVAAEIIGPGGTSAPIAADQAERPASSVRVAQHGHVGLVFSRGLPKPDFYLLGVHCRFFSLLARCEVERSLSVLLPVCNAQSTLALTLLEILEILPELTRQFELVIIDDGSDDATIEVADEWAARYPQIRVICHAKPLGRAAAIETGLERSTGEIIFLRDENCILAIEEIDKLWQAIGQHELVLARPSASSDSGSSRWKRRHHGHQGGFQMVHRRAIQQLQRSIVDQTTLMTELTRRGLQWHEVEIHRQSSHRPSRLSVAGRRPFRPAGPPESSSPRPNRPNYLARLKDFALGE